MFPIIRTGWPEGGFLSGSGLEMLDVGEGRSALRLELRAVGRDRLLLITGGAAHAGAVSLAEPGDDAPRVRTLTAGTHREGPLSAEAAADLCRATGRAVVVVAGIHIDDARPEEIERIVKNARTGVRALIERICE